MRYKAILPIPILLLLTGCISSGTFAVPNSPVFPNVIEAAWDTEIKTLKEDGHHKIRFQLGLEVYSPALDKAASLIPTKKEP